MKKRLSLLIPQYKEDDSVIKPLLDSLIVQQNIDFDDIEVVIVNDGTDIKLSKELLEKYPFDIHYYDKDHEGVSAARQYAFDKCSGEYVMWCDIDDMFFDACGLFLILKECDGKCDGLISVFREESRMPDKSITYINRGDAQNGGIDSTFVHGKVYRKKYLINNNIKWNKDLQIHEDSYFNILARTLSKTIKYCPLPFYLWKWRDESVCRHDPLYLNKTMVDMLKSNTALVNEFIDRNMEEESIFYATSMIFDMYYGMNCDRWWTEEGKPFVEMTEKAFKKYYLTFKELFEKCPEEAKAQIIMGEKNRYFQEGMLLERVTFNDWIKHIEDIKD